MTKFEKERRKKNTNTLAIHNAIYNDNKKRRKALITFSLEDEKVNSIIKLRQRFFAVLNKVVKRVKYKEHKKIAYFSNIEIAVKRDGRHVHPHIHMLLYYDDIQPIMIAYEAIKDEYNPRNYDLIDIEPNKYVGYLAKEFVLVKTDKETGKEIDMYDNQRELNKLHYARGRKLVTASRKK